MSHSKKIKTLAKVFGLTRDLPYNNDGFHGELYDVFVEIEDRFHTGVVAVEVICADEAFLLDLAKFIRTKCDERLANMEGLTSEQKASIRIATKGK